VSRVALVIIVAVIGTVLWPLRAVAATIPTFIAYDVAVRSTATTALGRYDAVRPDAEHANTACDCASFGYGEPSRRHLARGGGAVDAYDGAHEVTQRREVVQGVIYDAPAATKAAEGFEAIGSTGKIGEQALQQLGGESQAFFRTSQGARFVDQLVGGVANEAKVGYQSLTPTIARQIAKDAELLGTGQVSGVTWHFFQSPVTGLSGPSGPLLEALEQAGIDVEIH
jgi:hypothetical protein